MSAPPSYYDQGQQQPMQVAQVVTAYPPQQAGQPVQMQQPGVLMQAQQAGYGQPRMQAQAGYGQPTFAVAQPMQQQGFPGQHVAVVTQPMALHGAAYISPAAMGTPPVGAPAGGVWARESFCGPVTLLIGICFFIPSCFCPCDQRNVYIAPDGMKYNEVSAGRGGLLGVPAACCSPLAVVPLMARPNSPPSAFCLFLRSHDRSSAAQWACSDALGTCWWQTGGPGERLSVYPTLSS